MHATLLSDAHLKCLDDPAQVALVAFLEHWQTDAWVLVGDILDVWWSWRSVVYVDYLPLLSTLHRVSQRGISVSWVPGNHDFAPGPAVESLGIDVLPDWRDPTGRVLAVHGDAFDQRRRQIVLNRFLRGRIARAAMHIAGPDLGQRLARRVSDTSRNAGAPADSRLLERQARWVEELAATRGVSTVCVGHTHAPGITDVGRARLVNLGDWIDHRTFATVQNGEVTLQRWTGTEALPVEGPPARRQPNRPTSASS